MNSGGKASVMSIISTLFFIAIVVVVKATTSQTSLIVEKDSEHSRSERSALERARKLQAPLPSASYNGESENAEWWDENDALLKAARRVWGNKHSILYERDRVLELVDPTIREAVKSKDARKLKALVEPIDPSLKGVFKIPSLLSEETIDLILEELEHHEQSGIPTRRPNGMNRFGVILSELNTLEEGFVRGLNDQVLRPMLHLLFPDRLNMEDVAHSYSFVVKYQAEEGGDINLAEHSDASVVTTNICLLPDSNTTSPLYFKRLRDIGQEDPLLEDDDGQAKTFVALNKPGMAVIHLGQHVHGVAPVTGDRSNLVTWFFGEYGYVRVAPYPKKDTAMHREAFSRSSGWNHAGVLQDDDSLFQEL